MAEKKPSGFRFRLPWLLQPSLTPAKEPPTKSPRATTQTSVASTPAQRPPFRPPGKAPAPAPPVASPPMVATSAPASPEQSPPQSPSPPPPVSTKSSAPKSPIGKSIEPVATQPAKEPQTTTETESTIETTGPVSPPQTRSFRPTRQVQFQPSPPQTPPPAKPNSQPSSPSHLPTPPQPNSKPLSPSRMAAQPHEVTQPEATSKPPSPVHLQPSQTRTPPRSPSSSPSPSPSSSQPRDKPSKLPSPPTESTKEVSEIKRSIETTEEKIPVHLNHVPQGEGLSLDAKPREITKVEGGETKSMDSHSMETKLQKPKPITTARVPLHKEIKDDISKFIHKIATSSSKKSMDEKPASVITVAGDNTGASMHLGLDSIKRGYKLTTDGSAHDAAINGDRSSKRDSKAGENQETKAIVNSNIQGINNSMMFNSSVNERNPGVHLGFCRNLANINDSKMRNTESMEMQRAEVNITPPQKFIYEPTTERSRGELFMEPSDSEPDDPETSGKGYEIEVL